MSDLKRAIEHFEGDKGLSTEFQFTLAAMKEAADELERLQARVEELEAEIERLSYRVKDHVLLQSEYIERITELETKLEDYEAHHEAHHLDCEIANHEQALAATEDKP